MKAPIKYYAEQANYFGTSQRAADTWLKIAEKELVTVGGRVLRKAAVEEESHAAFMIEFLLDGDTFRMVYPVMECRKKTPQNFDKAKVQAATFLYHSVKARALDIKILGARVAFGSWLLVDGKRSVADVVRNGSGAALPKMLQTPQNPTSDVVEGVFIEGKVT